MDIEEIVSRWNELRSDQRNKYAEFGRNMRSYFNLDVQSGKSKIVF